MLSETDLKPLTTRVGQDSRCLRCFHFTGNLRKRPVYFFPAPVTGIFSDDASLNQQLKKISWLDAAQLEKWLQTGDIDERSLVVRGAFCTARTDLSDDFNDFMVKAVHPRIYVPRMPEASQDTVPFYIERIFFRPYCGMFFLARFEDNSLREQLMAALDYLRTAGIGTDRNVGHGQFRYEIADFEHLNDLPASDFAYNLSLFCPETPNQLADMIGHEESRHMLIKRGGWITSGDNLSIRKNAVYMFREGSVFKTNALQAGATVNLRPAILGDGHPIWRVGRSLFLPLVKR
ncbi:MAG: type III-A CRISPR-associated RAMP protein Csm4 [Saprospirales bacterium]|nr:type III-A CRISPR-associated RAMP protein Csm4 [Saprospirales bacterium]